MRTDTSLEVNTANNYFARVFPCPERTRYFIEQHGMPTGAYIAAASGKTVLSDAFDGESILGVDRIQKYNYFLRDDRFGFAAWIRFRGARAWMKYLVTHPREILPEFRSEYHKIATTSDLTDPLLLTRSCPPGKQKETLIRLMQNEHYGLNRAAGLQILAYVMTQTRLNDVYVLTSVSLLLFLLLAFCFRSRDLSVLEVGSGFFAVSFVTCFLSLYGDGMEFKRHLVPPFVFLCFAVLIIILGAAAPLCAKPKS